MTKSTGSTSKEPSVHTEVEPFRYLTGSGAIQGLQGLCFFLDEWWDIGPGEIAPASGSWSTPEAPGSWSATFKWKPPQSGNESLTLVYSAADGTEKWQAKYDGPGKGDIAQAVGAGPDGLRVFVGGTSQGVRGSWDYAVVAYETGEF